MHIGKIVDLIRQEKKGVEIYNERKKDGHKMYGRSEKCIQKDGSWINGRFAKKKKRGMEIEG